MGIRYLPSEYDEETGEELIPVCKECESPEIGEVSAGDEGWTVCEACRSVEQGYVYIPERLLK